MLSKQEKEIEMLWNQLLKTTLEMFGFEYREIYQSESFNRLYSEYKHFIQKKNYSHFALWLFGLYVLNILQQFQDNDMQQKQIKRSSNLPSILRQLIFCPFLIIVLICTKPILNSYIESDLLYFIQNIIVICTGVLFPRVKQQEYGIFLEFFIYQTNLESLPFKIVYILISQLLQKDVNQVMDLVVFIILFGSAIYQEVSRFTSCMKDYEKVEQERKNERYIDSLHRQILEFILDTQDNEEKEKIYQKLKKQLKEKKKKINIDSVLDYIF